MQYMYRFPNVRTGAVGLGSPLTAWFDTLALTYETICGHQVGKVAMVSSTWRAQKHKHLYQSEWIVYMYCVIDFFFVIIVKYSHVFSSKSIKVLGRNLFADWSSDLIFWVTKLRIRFTFTKLLYLYSVIT